MKFGVTFVNFCRYLYINMYIYSYEKDMNSAIQDTALFCRLDCLHFVSPHGILWRNVHNDGKIHITLRCSNNNRRANLRGMANCRIILCTCRTETERTIGPDTNKSTLRHRESCLLVRNKPCLITANPSRGFRIRQSVFQ